MESDAPHLEKVSANQMHNYQNENSQEKNDLYKKRKNARGRPKFCVNRKMQCK
jgi:hypothetical protein